MTKVATKEDNTKHNNEESSLSVVASSTTGLRASTATTTNTVKLKVSASTVPASACMPSNLRPAVRGTAAASKATADPKSSTKKATTSAACSAALDFISTGRAVKTLFSIPYDESPRPVCLAVHNLDGTLIIDQAEDEQNYFLKRRDDFFVGLSAAGATAGAEEDGLLSTNAGPSSSSLLLPPASESLALVLAPGARKSEALALLSNVVQPLTSVPETTTAASASDKPTSSDAKLLDPPTAPREYVEWKFQDMNLLVASDAMVVRPTTTTTTNTSSRKQPVSSSPSSDLPPSGIAVRVEEVHRLRNASTSFKLRQQQLLQTEQLLPSPSTAAKEALLSQPQQQRSYAQALLRAPEEVRGNDKSSSSARIKEGRHDGDDDTPEKADQEDSSFAETPLQTCIVPFSGPLGGRLLLESSSLPSSVADAAPSPQSSVGASSPERLPSSSFPALSIVMDAYLDNLMTNVPQLALCLQEKGLIQSIKLLQTEEIPSMMMHPSTLDTSIPMDTMHGGSKSQATNLPYPRRRAAHQKDTENDMFSPQIMEMNASALLRFLKANCTRNNATYLLRHEPTTTSDGSNNDPARTTHHNIQLYDISSISNQGQKKWIWWLATMSYRFALRLRHLEASSSPSLSSQMPESQRRAIRDRERSLFQQTLDLLQDLMDMDGNAHESMVASVRENMAETYLREGEATKEFGDRDESGKGSLSPMLSPSQSPVNPPALVRSHSPPIAANFIATETAVPTAPNAFPQQQRQQPYAAVSVDALNKAQDHLVHGIKALATLLDKDLHRVPNRKPDSTTTEECAGGSEMKHHGRRRKRPDQSDSENKSRGEEKEPDRSMSPAMIMQLLGMNYTLVNVTLRLAEHHLKNYYSSSAMQALRTAARRLAEAAHLLDFYLVETGSHSSGNLEEQKWKESLRVQYIWLLEHCGHFARSFASDDLWRDRGHASGDDVISVLRDVECAFTSNEEKQHQQLLRLHQDRSWKLVKQDPLLEKSGGRVSLQSLSAVVGPVKLDEKTSQKAVDAAETFLAMERVLQRDKRRVLVASCISYSRAIDAFQSMRNEEASSSNNNTNSTSQRTKSSNGKPGTPAARSYEPVLNLLRQRLGDSCNETGKVLLGALRSLLMNSQGAKRDERAQLAAEALIDSAQFWFTEGLEAFESCGDVRNLALLRCNLCQSYKLRANSGFARNDEAVADPSPSKHAEHCLEEAANQLLKAHENLGERDGDPRTWDMVSEELAATFLVLGVRRRQSLLGGGNAPLILQVLRLSPGEERAITDPMERSLKIYDQSGNKHQAAAVHYQLALTYSKLWTCQLNESKTREKLAAAFDHYSLAYSFFSTHSRNNEATYCLLCLDLANLYATVAGEEGMFKALGCCLDTCDSFSLQNIKAVPGNMSPSEAKQWYDQLETLAESMEERVFKLLRNLAKSDPYRFKDMYRDALSAKMVHSVAEDDELDGNHQATALLKLHGILLAVKRNYGALIQK